MVHEAHTLHLNIQKTSESHYVAHCIEFPSIIVQAKTKSKVKEEALTAITGYLKTFPEEHDVLINKELESEKVVIEV